MKDKLNSFIPEQERREIEAMYREAKHESGEAEPLRCRWGRHRWSKWWVIMTGQIVEDVKDENSGHVGHYVEQKRFCLLCHKVGFRKESVR